MGKRILGLSVDHGWRLLSEQLSVLFENVDQAMSLL